MVYPNVTLRPISALGVHLVHLEVLLKPKVHKEEYNCKFTIFFYVITH